MWLDEGLASAFAGVALANVSRAFPHKLDHLIVAGYEPLAASHVTLHPAFFGSYDWHSAVHMHWLLVRILRLEPGVPEAAAIRELCAERFTPTVMGRELDYLQSPAGRTFERPYGWAWLLELRAELERLRATEPSAALWAAAVDPMAREIAGRLRAFAASAPYPIRTGTHANTAFAVILAIDFARTCHDPALEGGLTEAADRWYGADRAAPVAYEPSLTDFLSPILAEAAAMRAVLPEADYRAWLDTFLPDDLGPLGKLPRVVDRHDPQIAHLDGLSLSRAWMLGRIASGLPAGDARVANLLAASKRHLKAGLPRTVGGEYVGEHWLASFAALALGDVP